jgi:hypothetical protein
MRKETIRIQNENKQAKTTRENAQIVFHVFHNKHVYCLHEQNVCDKYLFIPDLPCDL